MTLEQAKQLLSMQLKDMSPAQKSMLRLAMKIVANSWGNL